MNWQPLTEAQSGLWYAQQLAPDNPAFNTAHALWMDGPLNLDAFAQALRQGCIESPALALQMRMGADGPEQRIHPTHQWGLNIEDVSADPDPAARAREAMRRERLTPLNPATTPLALNCLYLLGDNRHVWYLRVHHLATDGYGMALFADRVCALYNAAMDGTEPGLTLAALAPVLDEDRAYQTNEHRERDKTWWHDTLTGMPVASGLGPGFAAASHDCLRKVFDVPVDLRERLTSAAERIGQPWPDVLTALTASYCQRISGQEEAVIGVPFMGRLGSASARVPAMVMNVLPLRVPAFSESTITDYIQTLSRTLVRSRRHGRYRGEQLRRDLGLIGGQRRLHGPLVNVQPFYRPPQMAGLSVTLDVLATGPVDDATLGFRGNLSDMLDLEIEANPALYNEASVNAHTGRLLAFISAALDVDERGGTLAEIPLATPVEAEQCLYTFNATAHPVPDTTLTALIEAQMAATPNAPALEYAGTVLTYAELDTRTRALALQLRDIGVMRESIVAIALPRSLELEIALVAILRAGGAYLPIDLSHPDERIGRILASAKPVCVLALEPDAVRFGALPALLPAQWTQADSRTLDHRVKPSDAAYVIYTSGSTGEPKGVLIEHRAIVNRLEWMRVHYGFTSGDRILQKTPMTFDVSVWEFFLPLLSGATLVMAPPDAHRDPLELAALIQNNAITTLHFVPSMLAAFLSVPTRHGFTIKRVFCSGEELGADLHDRFHQAIKGELHNLYGPTEAAVDVSYWNASADDKSQPVPIGFPVWNTRLYILDAHMRPLPIGVAGDLYLGGVQLARGYLGRDDLTAERFLPDPFLPGERIYKTGDLARWREDGAVVFLGRSDHQVKIRGLRIELGEIEAALRASAQVARGEVIVREDRPGERRLVAYVQPTSTLDPYALRTELTAKLPDYMVPSAILALDDWPVTSNGKLDRRRLPAPPVETGQGTPLSTPSEHRMAALFAEVLKISTSPIDAVGERANTAPSIGADTDFFALGGDSLSAVQLLLAIQTHWQRDPGLGAIFETPTVAGLAALMDAEHTTTDDGLAPAIRLLEGDPALAPLFVIHPAGGIAWNYRDLARALNPRRSVYGLQSPVLDPSQPAPSDIAELARGYAARIHELAPTGPIHLAGWSVGGIIAQAIATELHARHRHIGVVALLDAYPADVWRDEPEPDPIMALRALLAIAGYDPDAHQHLDTRAKIVEFLRQGDSALGNLPGRVLDGVVRAVTDTNRLIRAHHHQHYPGTLLHIRAGHDHAAKPFLQSSLWAPYAAAVKSITIPFLHAHMTSRAASAQIAPLLDARMQHTKH